MKNLEYFGIFPIWNFFLKTDLYSNFIWKYKIPQYFGRKDASHKLPCANFFLHNQSLPNSGWEQPRQNSQLQSNQLQLDQRLVLLLHVVDPIQLHYPILYGRSSKKAWYKEKTQPKESSFQQIASSKVISCNWTRDWSYSYISWIQSSYIIQYHIFGPEIIRWHWMEFYHFSWKQIQDIIIKVIIYLMSIYCLAVPIINCFLHSLNV